MTLPVSCVKGDRQPQSLLPGAGTFGTALALRAPAANGIRDGLLYRTTLAAAAAALAWAVGAGAWGLGGGVHGVSPLVESDASLGVRLHCGLNETANRKQCAACSPVTSQAAETT